MICANCYKSFNESEKICDNCNFPLTKNCVIKNVVVKNLFNSKDYDIDFSNDKNVSILIAPNGFGKSTIFRFIKFFYEPNLELLDKFSDIPFYSFRINFTNGGFVCLKKRKEDADVREFKKYNFVISGKLAKDGRFVKIDIFEDLVKPRLKSCDFKDIYKKVDFEIKNIFANTKENFIPLKGLFLDLRRLEIKKSTMERLDVLKAEQKNELIEDLISNKDSATNISIYNYNVSNIVENYIKYSVLYKNMKELKQMIENNQVPSNINLGAFKNIDQKSEHLEQITAEVKDRKKRLDLFCKIYNERNKYSGKKISYNSDGFVIMEGTNVVPLEKLSDGEKNDFCIFYNLIFNTENKKKVSNIKSNRFSLIIIDEPELSLHIEWQKTWLNYVLEICKTRNVQVIISTHSPYIVDANFDLYANKKVKNNVR